MVYLLVANGRVVNSDGVVQKVNRIIDSPCVWMTNSFRSILFTVNIVGDSQRTTGWDNVNCNSYGHDFFQFPFAAHFLEKCTFVMHKGAIVLTQ